MEKTEAIGTAGMARIFAFIDKNPYAYMTIYGPNGSKLEGTVRSLSRLSGFRSLEFRSFFSMDTGDGGIEIEAAI